MNLIDLFRFRTPIVPLRKRGPRRAVIALGGGGARGLAHLGAIEVVGEAGIHTEQFVGVSMGALVGALCATEPDIRHVQARTIEFLFSPTFSRNQELLFGSTTSHRYDSEAGIIAWYYRARKMYSAHRKLTRAVTHLSLLPEAMLSEAIETLIPDVDISDLKIPMSVVAVDLISGHRVVLEKGPLRKAIRASMAIPGIFPPVEWEGMLLCDIGVVDSLPSSIAKSYASDLTIAVDVGQCRTRMEEFSSALDVMMRIQDIGESLMRYEKALAVDCLIRPHLDGIAWFDFSKPERIIELGREAARKQIAKLKVAR